MTPFAAHANPAASHRLSTVLGEAHVAVEPRLYFGRAPDNVYTNDSEAKLYTTPKEVKNKDNPASYYPINTTAWGEWRHKPSTIGVDNKPDLWSEKGCAGGQTLKVRLQWDFTSDVDADPAKEYRLRVNYGFVKPKDGEKTTLEEGPNRGGGETGGDTVADRDTSKNTWSGWYTLPDSANPR